MSSGFGSNGMQGRCYSLWQDFSECMSDTSEPQKCFNKREDYMECLHHRKEITRYNTVMRTGAKKLEAIKAHPTPLPKSKMSKAELIGEMEKICNDKWVEAKANLLEDEKFDKATALERVAARKAQCTAVANKAYAKALAVKRDAANPAAATA